MKTDHDSPESVPIPAWHLPVLNERLADHPAAPKDGFTFEQSFAQATAKLQERRSRRG